MMATALERIVNDLLRDSVTLFMEVAEKTIADALLQASPISLAVSRACAAASRPQEVQFGAAAFLPKG